MRVAICFWGLFLRSLNYTQESIMENVIEVFANRSDVRADVYIHTYTTSTRSKTIEEEKTLIQTYASVLRPFVLTIDDQRVFDRSIDPKDYGSKGT